MGLIWGCKFATMDWYCEREEGHDGDHFMHVVPCKGPGCGCYKYPNKPAKSEA